VSLVPGSVLEGFELRLGDQPIWSGDAVVVHGSVDRIGGRFTSGVVDMPQLRLGATLEGRLALLAEQRARLPAEWRAAVADVRQLLEDARSEVEEFERAESNDPLRRQDEEAQLFDALTRRWGESYRAAIASLHEASKQLDERAAALGRSYASSMLMPLLRACPLHKRAYEKPLGYSGDYRMMEMCFAREPLGESLFGRFLFSISKTLSTVRTAVARARVLEEAIGEAVSAQGDGDRPVRILAVAAGPAMEVRRWLLHTQSLRRRVEIVVLDQDRFAHESAHRQVTRILLEQHHGLLPVTARWLHVSVRQLVSPRTPEELAVVSDLLGDLDLVYSTGLFDYLTDVVAQRLTDKLYSLLRPGGRMLIGNLVEAPDTAWIMDYVLDWPIIYRGPDDMSRFGERLAPRPTAAAITADATGGCIFLDVRA
jgi:hypothetical protein